MRLGAKLEGFSGVLFVRGIVASFKKGVAVVQTTP